jgi:NADH dehydrogenase FAD-containing subunit
MISAILLRSRSSSSSSSSSSAVITRYASTKTHDDAKEINSFYLRKDIHVPRGLTKPYSTRQENERERNGDHWDRRLVAALEQKIANPNKPGAHEIDSWKNDPLKKTIVVLGSGWGAISFIKALKGRELNEMFNVVVVSPRNYFLYTPLLPGVATGAIETRSIVESIRRPIAEKGFKFYEAQATDINAKERTVTFSNRYLTSAIATKWLPSVESKHKSQSFEMKYDYLVVAVGAIPNTFGVPGVEQFCLFFKEVSHAAMFRSQVNARFERAALPEMTEDQIKDLLRFVIIGAGPTGVELAAELYDLVYNDVAKTFPKRLLRHVSINIIDLQDRLLSTYNREIQDYATDFFNKANINCLLNTQVKEVKQCVLVVKDKNTGEEKELPFGMAVWCSGIKMNPLCENIMNTLPEDSQPNRRSLLADKALRVKGSDGSIFAIGDCVTLEPKSFPATAQVAKQEAYFLADRFNKAAQAKSVDSLADPKAEFVYTHRGSLAYIGKDAAVADIPGVTILKGILAGFFWKSFETVSQVSYGNSFKVGCDMLRTKIWGRDISRLL